MTCARGCVVWSLLCVASSLKQKLLFTVSLKHNVLLLLFFFLLFESLIMEVVASDDDLFFINQDPDSNYCTVCQNVKPSL